MQTLVLTRSDAVALSLLLPQSLSVHVHVPSTCVYTSFDSDLHVVFVKSEFEAVGKTTRHTPVLFNRLLY